MLTVPTHYAIFFPVYDQLKKNGGNKVFASVLAGAISEIFTNPFWVVRTRLQTHHLHFPSSSEYGILKTFRDITKKEGFLGFYKGFGTTLLALVQVGIFMPLYEVLKGESLCGNTSLGIMCASSTARVVAMTCSYPIEVLRTRFQDQRAVGEHRKYTGLISAVRLILKEEGGYAFYAGITANYSRIVPNTAACLLGYEWTVSLLNEWN